MSMRIKRARLTTEELYQLKWLIGGILSLLSLWALSSLELDSGFYLFCSSFLVLSSLIWPKRLAALSPMVWRVAGPIILVVTVVDFGLGLTNFFPPLMRMVLLLLVYRALAPRARREDLQLILLCLFSVVVSGALSVSLLFAAQILIFTPVAMALLFVICLLDRGPETAKAQSSWDYFSWSRLIRRVWSVVDLRVLALGTLLFAFVVSAATGFFVLIPRFNLEQAIPFLKLQSKPRSGFSDRVQLGSVSEITEDHRIALRVDVPSLEAISTTPYWRVLVLDHYRDGVFSLSEKMGGFRKHERLRELPEWENWEVPFSRERTQRWTFYFEGGVSQYLPLPGAFYSMRFPLKQDTVLLPDLHVVGLDVVPQSAFSYQIKGILWDVRAPASVAENEAFRAVESEWMDATEDKRYPYTNLELAIEASDRAHLAELNRTLINGATDLSAAQYSEIVTSHLRQEFSYSLKSNGTNGPGDPVVSWLTTGNLGHCELFAGAFVLLARDAGYPARMAVGFVGGGWNSVEDFFVVRNSNAHAWVEIYDAQSQEWLRVDPTPGASPSNPEITLPASFDVETGMGAWVDSLRMQWYRRVVNFDQDDQVELATSAIDLGNELMTALSERLKEMGASFSDWISQPFSRGSVIRYGVIFIFGAGGVLVWHTRYQWLHVLFHLLRRPLRMDPIRRAAAHQLARVRVRIEESDPDDPRLAEFRAIRGQLEALRFGPEVSVASAKVVFNETKRCLRRWPRV